MKQPKFKVGQVVGVRRWSCTYFGKVAAVSSIGSSHYYSLLGWASEVHQRFLRPLTKKEIANGK